MITDKGTKWCNQCKQHHPAYEFGNSKNSPDGKQYACKKVMNYYGSKRYQESKKKYDDIDEENVMSIFGVCRRLIRLSKTNPDFHGTYEYLAYLNGKRPYPGKGYMIDEEQSLLDKFILTKEII